MTRSAVRGSICAVASERPRTSLMNSTTRPTSPFLANRRSTAIENAAETRALYPVRAAIGSSSSSNLLCSSNRPASCALSVANCSSLTGIVNSFRGYLPYAGASERSHSPGHRQPETSLPWFPHRWAPAGSLRELFLVGWEPRLPGVRLAADAPAGSVLLRLGLSRHR